MQNINTTIDRVFAARELAVKAHGDQKYGDSPYVVHLDDVATLCLHHLPHLGVRVNSRDGFMSFKPLVVDCLVAAYVHDVLEDTGTEAEEIAAVLGQFAADCAVALSDPPGKNRKERKALLHERLAALHDSTPIGAVVLGVKTMDRLANSRKCRETGNAALLAMYRKEAPDFRKAVYRLGMCAQAWTELKQICE